MILILVDLDVSVKHVAKASAYLVHCLRHIQTVNCLLLIVNVAVYLLTMAQSVFP
jgi:hypothetical protein